MHNSEQIKRLKDSTTLWNEWRNNNRSVIPDLTRGNLRMADLGLADLSGVRLWETDLRGARASRASFSRADLTAARLDDAQLEKSNFSNAILTRACFRDAKMHGTSFFEALVKDADFRGANLATVSGIHDWAEFKSQIRYDEKTIFPDKEELNKERPTSVEWAPTVHVAVEGQLEIEPDIARSDVPFEERSQLLKLATYIVGDVVQCMRNSNAVASSDVDNFSKILEVMKTHTPDKYGDAAIVVDGMYATYMSILPSDLEEADSQLVVLLDKADAAIHRLNMTYTVFRAFIQRLADENFANLPNTDKVPNLLDAATGSLATKSLTKRALYKVRRISEGLLEAIEQNAPHARPKFAATYGVLRNIWSAAETFLIRAKQGTLAEAERLRKDPIERLQKYASLLLATLNLFKHLFK